MDGINVKYDPQRDFTTLEAWKKTRLLKLFFYKEVIPSLPLEERFDLNSQIRRACISITANIAEGYGRYYYQEGIRFYRIARGSIYELKDHLTSCYDLEFVNAELYERRISLIEDSKLTLNGYIKFVGRQNKV